MKPRTSLLRTLFVTLIAVESFASVCGPGADIPEPDFCSQGSVGTLDTLEIGTGSDTAFTPLRDGDQVSLVFGGQGGLMLGVRLRAAGADVPTCLTLRTTAENATGDTIAEVVGAVATHPDGDNARATTSMFMVFNFDAEPTEGDSITVRATVGDMEVAHVVQIGPL